MSEAARVKFEDLIGTDIFVRLKGTITVEEGSEPISWMSGELLGVEPAGIWIWGQQLAAVFGASIWERDVRDFGIEGVGTTSLRVFFPFTEVFYILSVVDRDGPGGLPARTRPVRS